MHHRDMINLVSLIGTIEEEPEVRYFGFDDLEVRLRLQTIEHLPLRGIAETRELKLWHQLSARGSIAKALETQVHAGTKLHVQGHLRYYRETDQFGSSRNITEIELIEVQILEHPQNKNTPLVSPPQKEPTQEAQELDWSSFACSTDEDPMA